MSWDSIPIDACSMVYSLAFQLLLYSLHPFYVSITSIDYKPDRKSIEISCRIFYDDLEKALSEESKEKINLIHPIKRSVVDSILARYLRQNLKLTVNEKNKDLRYLGYEIEEDVAWCFIETPQAEAIKKLDIESRLLYELFDTQSNIFHVSVGKQRRSMKFDNPKRHSSLHFD